MSTAATFRFDGKTALVTGAGRGIGRATAKALVAAGAVVYGLSKTKANLDSLVAECPSIRPVCVDLTDWNSTKKAVEDIGPVDLLVNNAGIMLLQPFLDIDPKTFDDVFNVNVKGVIPVSQVVVKGMIQRGCPGAIVNVSTLGSQRAAQAFAVYSASKAALDQLTRVMALELGPHKIRVNAVNPTAVPTDMGNELLSNPAVAAALLSRTPLGKVVEEQDVTDAILYLLSDNASMLNGVTLPVDGGALCT